MFKPVSEIQIEQGAVYKNGTLLLENIHHAEELYRYLNLSYIKFFKMDLLSKWAFAATELLLKAEDTEQKLDESFNKEKVALVFASREGCIDVDRQFLKSTETIASPALFVYTLPNIMMGEIAIRNGYKGEQICFLQEAYDDRLESWAADLLLNKDMEACIVGFVNATGKEVTVQLKFLKK